MYIIRLRKKRKSTGVFSKNILEIILIKKSKALYSNAQRVKLGIYNKKTNIVSIQLDTLYYWVGFGAVFSHSSYKILNPLLF
jgi:ribosomal protein S16